MTVRRRTVLAAGLSAVALALAFAAVGDSVPDRPVVDRAAGPFVVPGEQPSSSPSVVSAVDPSSGAPGGGAAPADVAALPAQAAIEELRTATPTPPALTVDASGHVRSVSAPPEQALAPAPGVATSDAQTAAAAFVNRYGEGFGLRPGDQARVVRVDDVPGGRVVRLQHEIGGVPVLGGDLVVAVNGAGGVQSASAETSPLAPVSTQATVAAHVAASNAISAAESALGLDGAQLVARSTDLWLYDPKLIDAPGGGELRPTWWVTLGWSDRPGNVASVFIDAIDGTTALAFSEVMSARDRLVCDLANISGLNIESDWTTYDCSDAPGDPPVKRREGQGATGIADVDLAYEHLGATYDFYLANFGRDSIDGRGYPLIATVRACQIVCPYRNAFWDGVQMVYGPGFAVDDVVGHEVTHGLTQHISSLVYFGQSGAINEALSDIMGEFIDKSRGADDDSAWLVGEDLPIGAIRSMKSPNLYQQPDAKNGTYWTTHWTNSFDNYGVHGLSGVVNRAAFLLAEGGTQNGFSVAGIGLAKSAQLWYRLQYLLPSGAELTDLVSLLPAACRSIVGMVTSGGTITASDCVQAELATLATRMNEGDTSVTAEPDLCPVAGQPVQFLFHETFERGLSRWSMPSSVWLRLPAADIPLTWANTGAFALYGYRDSSTPAAYVDLDAPVTIPSSGTTYLRYAHNVLAGSAGRVYYKPAGAASYTSSFTNSNYPVVGYDVPSSGTKGYKWVRWDISARAGETLQLGLGTLASSEWFIDDIQIYQCINTLPGAPTRVAGQLSPDATSAVITWGAPAFVPTGGVVSYEISVGPSGQTLTVASDTLTVTLDDLDPAVRYGVTVRAVGVNGPGPGLTIRLPSDPLYVCNPPPGAANPRRVCAPDPVSAPPPV